MDELTERELNRKFQRTCIAVKHVTSGKELFCYVLAIGNGLMDCNFCDRPTEFISNVNSVKMTRGTLKLKNIEILPIPDTSVYDANGHTQVFTHRPARQWRIGVCNDNSNFYSPIYNLIEDVIKGFYNEVMWYAHSFDNGSNQSLLHLFFPFYSNTIQEAISVVEKEKLYSKAINSKWFVSLGHKENTFVLFFKQHPVALIDKKNNIINVQNNLFYQEVRDLVHRTGDNYYVRQG